MGLDTDLFSIPAKLQNISVTLGKFPKPKLSKI